MNKRHNFVTGRYETGAASENVHEELSELLGELEEIPEGKALAAAAYFL